VAGLTDEGRPFISAMDLLGAPVVTDTFAVSGTCTSNLRGMCEAMYRPDLVGRYTAGTGAP
jgi:20S proteasome subunit beta 3